MFLDVILILIVKRISWEKSHLTSPPNNSVIFFSVKLLKEFLKKFNSNVRELKERQLFHVMIFQ